MADWADTEASDLVERHAYMRSDTVVALHGALERAIASKLRLAKIAGGLEALQEVQRGCGVAS